MRAAILVVGDLGRSPRVQYHALACAAAGVDVDLIGLHGSEPFPAVRHNPRITCHVISPVAAPALVRAMWDGARALSTLLFSVPAPDVILIQNPPAIPTMLAGWIAARLRSARLVIDWHNLGYSMLALRYPGRQRMIAVARWLERALGRKADGNLCVSKAMQAVLKSQWGIDAAVLYDRPVEEMFAVEPHAAQDARRRLSEILNVKISSDTVVMISPTSWSLDEDFDLLVDAVRRCEELMHGGEKEGKRYHALLLLLTGRGPRRAVYEARLTALSSDRIRVMAMWLESDDYHRMLRAADLGLSLHRSASGLDLPMKIADMFGAGLPVLVLDYGPVLKEILRDGEDSRLFADSAGLAAITCDLVEDSLNAVQERLRLAKGAITVATPYFIDHWNSQAVPLVLISDAKSQ
jgi:beta-1,4-mannosyltransferase